MLLGVSAQQVVYLFNQAYLVDDAGHDPQMVDVLNFDLWCIRLIHAPENTSACTTNLRNVSCKVCETLNGVFCLASGTQCRQRLTGVAATLRPSSSLRHQGSTRARTPGRCW